MPLGQSLSAGDSIVFALAYSPAGHEMCYVSGGDSICVLLTGVTDLGVTDPASGQALYRFSWEPPGQKGSSDTITQQIVKSGVSHGRAQ
jgi:hypothetical protein